MDQTKGISRRHSAVVPPSPLHFHKQSSRDQAAGHQHRQDFQANASKPLPRTPLVTKTEQSSSSESIYSREVAETPQVTANTAYSALGDCVKNYFSGVSDDTQSMRASRSTLSSIKGHYLSDSSSAIIGDFIPIDSTTMNGISNRLNGGGPSEPFVRLGEVPRYNPYEFEPNTPLADKRQTTITDFIRRHDSSPATLPSPRMGHMKNSRSEANAMLDVPRPNPLSYAPAVSDKPYRPLHKSGSSPNISSFRFEPNKNFETPPLPAFNRDRSGLNSSIRDGRFVIRAEEYEETGSPILNGRFALRTESHEAPASAVARENRGLDSAARSTWFTTRDKEYEASVLPTSARGNRRPESPTRSSQQTESSARGYERPGSPVRSSRNTGSSRHTDSSRRGQQYPEGRTSPSRSYRGVHDSNGILRAYSPTGFATYSCDESARAISPSYDRRQTKSPTKTLTDVIEKDEPKASRGRREKPDPVPSPPKRSRSPMKKLFGDKGWLGQSPDELNEVKVRIKNASLARNEDSPNRQKKSGMMGRLKSKFDEITEKADMTPKKRSANEKSNHIPVLSISLGPPEQARISMELELMLVHTANTFLMNQFSQGRMSVDSIKKTVDSWRGKGRPRVIEFMYDQATQQNLVLTNQLNFRFHGERAGDDIRINSMLYNWKKVGSLMAIRTFCWADTVILKLLFDIEQILELLGAAEAIMLRVQQIRARVNELMRAGRHLKDSKASTVSQRQVNGEEQVLDDYHASLDSRSRAKSFDDPYGGLKLVPDSYRER